MPSKKTPGTTGTSVREPSGSSGRRGKAHSPGGPGSRDQPRDVGPLGGLKDKLARGEKLDPTKVDTPRSYASSRPRSPS